MDTAELLDEHSYSFCEWHSYCDVSTEAAAAPNPTAKIGCKRKMCVQLKEKLEK